MTDIDPPRTQMEFRDRIKDFRRVRAGDIAGAGWNWRAHPESQRAAVADSLEELGFFSPLECRERPDGGLELIDGHLRQDIVTAAVGPDTLVPVVVTDFDEAEAKKANLYKDPLAAMAETDAEKLAALMGDVATDSDALNEMLAGLTSETFDVKELDELPDLLPTDSHTLTIRYDDSDEGLIKRFVGCPANEPLHPVRTGKIVLERIKAVVTGEADHK